MTGALPTDHVSTPPPEPVEWRVFDVQHPRRSVLCWSQFWVTARMIGAAELGLPIDRVEAKRKRGRAA